VLSALESVVKVLLWIVKTAVRPLFLYPIELSNVGQFETKIGYVFVTDVRAKKHRLISIPKNGFSVKIVFDRNLVTKDEKEKLAYDETVSVFDSEVVLNTHLTGKSYGNVLDYVP